MIDPPPTHRSRLHRPLRDFVRAFTALAERHLPEPALPAGATPLHDHTVWGLIGMLRGREVSQPHVIDPRGKAVPAGTPVELRPGQVEALSPRLGDITTGLLAEPGEARLASPHIDRYRRPYEGTDTPREAMQGYLDWEFGLVAQLGRDATHGFGVPRAGA